MSGKLRNGQELLQAFKASAGRQQSLSLPVGDPFAQWSDPSTGAPPAAEPMELTAEDLAEAAAEPAYDWASAAAEAAAEDQTPAVPGKDTMDFGAWMASSAQVPVAGVPVIIQVSINGERTCEFLEFMSP